MTGSRYERLLRDLSGKTNEFVAAASAGDLGKAPIALMKCSCRREVSVPLTGARCFERHPALSGAGGCPAGWPTTSQAELR